jgi:hypothetical protein
MARNRQHRVAPRGNGAAPSGSGWTSQSVANYKGDIYLVVGLPRPRISKKNLPCWTADPRRDILRVCTHGIGRGGQASSSRSWPFSQDVGVPITFKGCQRPPFRHSHRPLPRRPLPRQAPPRPPRRRPQRSRPVVLTSSPPPPLRLRVPEVTLLSWSALRTAPPLPAQWRAIRRRGSSTPAGNSWGPRRSRKRAYRRQPWYC